MKKPRRRRRKCGGVAHLTLILATLGLFNRSAEASTFDDVSGRLHLTDAIYSVTFDAPSSIPEETPLMFTDEHLSPLGPEEVTRAFQPDPEGLEGGGALHFGGTAVHGTLPFPDLRDVLNGRRVEIRIWQRPQGTRAIFDVVWQASDSGEEGTTIATIRMNPTGRVTDDGWEEWSTGPIDFAIGGAFGPSYLSFWDDQYLPNLFTLVDFAIPHFEELRVTLDALEIIDVGPALVTPEVCTVINENDVCGSRGLCLYGRCVDATFVDGPQPLEPQMRKDYLNRRIFEYSAFEGGRLPREQMRTLQEALEMLRDSPPDNTFWSTFQTVVEQLHDGHASWPYNAYPIRPSVGTCLHLGEADLIPGGGEMPLVFSSTGSDPFSTTLRAGDVLTEIDGLTPEEWTDQASRLLVYTGDPEGELMFITRDILSAAVLSGSRLTFTRCDPQDGSFSPCSNDELLLIEFDTVELVAAPLWEGRPPAWTTARLPECDFRFRRVVDHPNVFEMDFAGSALYEGVQTLIINAVPSYRWPNGPEWYEAVGRAFDPIPSAMILDQRTGHGGSLDGTDFVISPLIAADDTFAADMIPALDGPYDDVLRDVTADCTSFDMNGCGGIYRWIQGEMMAIPTANGAAAHIPLALLNSYDVSGNDYTAMFLSHRSGPFQIFGPAPTFGAFGPIYLLPSHLGEVMGGSVQLLDTLFLTAPDDSPSTFTTGFGVPPDQRVLQRQSDAIQGVDTMMEEALAWLAEEGV